MSALNAALRVVFDALLSPLRDLHPLVGIAIAALVVAVAMLLVYKRTSNQDALAEVKRQIQAGLFEIRLFNDDLRAILRSQFEILRYNLTYFRLSLAPMMWMLLPVALVIAQLQFHYGYEGLTPGRPALLKVQLDQEWSEAQRPAATLDVPEGIHVETPTLWAPALKQIAWRLGADRAGEYAVTVHVDGVSEVKSVVVSEAVVRRSPIRVSPNLLDEFMYPAEDPLPADGPIRSISLAYPERDVWFLGWDVHWLIVLLALSIAFAFMLRGPFGVTI